MSIVSHYAAVYLRYKDQFDELMQQTLDELHSYVRREFMSLPCKTVFVPKEMDSYDEVASIYKETGELHVSSLHNNSKVFPGELNLAFRTVHDWIHLKWDLPFDYAGEYDTYKVQSAGRSKQAKQVLFSEIVLQASYAIHYGTFLTKQKIVLL